MEHKREIGEKDEIGKYIRLKGKVRDMQYKLYAEDKTNYYFSTGRIVGDWWKVEERIGLCKLCGMEYQLPQRHGPIDLERCYPTGIPESEVCTECGRRADKPLAFIYNTLEHVAVCKDCLEAHHKLDYFQLKYAIILTQLEVWREQWNRKQREPDLGKVC